MSIATKAAASKGVSIKMPSPKKSAPDDNAPTSSSATTTNTTSRPIQMHHHHLLHSLKKPVRVPMVIAVYDSSDDCDDNDDDGDVFEDTSRKRAFPDKMDYSSSSRKREKLD